LYIITYVTYCNYGKLKKMMQNSRIQIFGHGFKRNQITLTIQKTSKLRCRWHQAMMENRIVNMHTVIYKTGSMFVIIGHIDSKLHKYPTNVNKI